MNELTEALAKQAAEYAIEFATQDQSLYIPKLMEKFAELIVRECVNIAFRNDVAKFTRDGYQIGMDIQKHFGVEE